MAKFMPMTAMPERIALSHAFGALAAGLVGTAEYTNARTIVGRAMIGWLYSQCILTGAAGPP